MTQTLSQRWDFEVLSSMKRVLHSQGLGDSVGMECSGLWWVVMVSKQNLVLRFGPNLAFSFWIGLGPSRTIVVLLVCWGLAADAIRERFN